MIQCAEIYLAGIYELLIKYLKKEKYLHADETTIQVLREPGRKAQTKSYEWLYRTSGRAERKIAIYEYQETRGKEHPEAFLKDFKGYLHTDGWKSYHSLPADITVVGCWAHARRYFEQALKIIPKEKQKDTDAYRAVACINELFRLERAFADLSPDERHIERQKQSRPLAEKFFTWVQTLHLLPKTPLGMAVDYAVSQRKYLMNVFLDGHLELSNNRAERSVKPFVIGRKNWLFAATTAGARASSIMYSIIETAKENGLHPYHYLEYLLSNLPSTASSELENFLPWSDRLPDHCFAPWKEPPSSL